MRRTPAWTAAALSLTATAGSLALAAPASAASTVPRCTVSVLKLTHTAQDIGAGNGVEDLVFANKGKVSCYLDGHPGVSYVGAKGRQIGASATRLGTIHKVILKPGARAVAQLHFVNIVSAEPGCETKAEQRMALGERVYPPGSTRALYTSDPHYACASTRVHLLRIGAVTS